MKHKPRILVTRSPQQASELADHLRALGAEPVLIPAIETVDPTDFAPLDAALQSLAVKPAQSDLPGAFQWLLFTSANAVEAFHRRVLHLGLEVEQLLKPHSAHPAKTRIAAIGPATARSIEAIGLAPDLVPPQAIAESLTTALLPEALQSDGTPTRFLLLRAEQAREHLPETLRAAGGEVTIAPAYRTVIPAGSVEAIRELFSGPTPPDAITFTSSSTARNLFTLLESAGLTLPPNIIRASIGPITSDTLRDLGFPPHVEATDATVSTLSQDLVKYLALWKTS